MQCFSGTGAQCNCARVVTPNCTGSSNAQDECQLYGRGINWTNDYIF